MFSVIVAASPHQSEECVNCKVVYTNSTILDLTLPTQNKTANVTTTSIAKVANKTIKPIVTPKPTPVPTPTPVPFKPIVKAAQPTPKPVTIVYFYQEYCSGCITMAPIIARLPYSVTKVDVNTNQATAKQYGITTTPTIVVIGKTTTTLAGVVTYEQIIAAANSVS